MKRMDFSIPEFTRIVWAPKTHEWQEKINKINRIWLEIERMSVAHNVRLGALQSVKPEDLINFQGYCLSNGIPFVILGREGAAEVYGNATSPVTEGKPWTYRVYMGADSGFFLNDWKETNNIAIGYYLGYPECCSKFFQKYWMKEGWRDLTPFMGPEGSYLCNILLRHLGVRSVFHLPCSFSCSRTQFLAQTILKMGYEAGFKQETEWIHEILRWPITWSSLHGVAIIETPIVKIVTSTDALEEIEVRTLNHENRHTDLACGDTLTWVDNGFKTQDGMNKGHDFILEIIRSEINPFAGRVLDLGCGNGLLLKRIITEYPSMIPSGVEGDPFKFRRVTDKFSNTQDFFCETIDKAPWQERDNTLILISLNRLFEAKDPEKLLTNLRRGGIYVLLYSYYGWHHDLDSLIIKHFKIIASRSVLSQMFEAKLMVAA